MKKFLSVALVWIVFIVMAIEFVLLMPALQINAEQTAKADLAALTEAAFQKMDEAKNSLQQTQAAADGQILSKARAVARILAHDDAQMATDGLAAMAELLELYKIDVVDFSGGIIASSDANYINTNVLQDAQLSWMQDVLDDPNASEAETDPKDETVRIACVPRTDTEGIIVVRGKDGVVEAAASAAQPSEVLRQMSFVQDTLEIVEGGEDGVTTTDGRFCLQTTKGDVTLRASRSVASVYIVRNAVALGMAVLLLVCVIAAIIIQILLSKLMMAQRPLVNRDKQEAETEIETLDGASDQPPETNDASWETPIGQEKLPPREKKRRKKQKDNPMVENPTVTAQEQENETETAQMDAPEPEHADENRETLTSNAADFTCADGTETQQKQELSVEEKLKTESKPASPKKKGRQGKNPASDNEDGFEKIF